jgi:purine nucleosidase
MARPVLIDTDMGVDDAIAVALALGNADLDVVGIISVGGNVDLDQATLNVGRLLRAIDPPNWPRVAKGLDQPDHLENAKHVHGDDGLGGADLPPAENLNVESADDLYADLLNEHAGNLTVVAIGPLTNVARALERNKNAPDRIDKLVIMGGAIWCPGNVEKIAEFNFYRDALAAQKVLNAGLTPTLVPLDVTRQIFLDDSHRGHLSASQTRTGIFLDAVLEKPIQSANDNGPGRFLVHDAIAVGSLLWPKLFMQTHIGIQVDVDAKVPGKTSPAVGKQPTRADVLVSVKALDFLENMLESLCQEHFVV